MTVYVFCVLACAVQFLNITGVHGEGLRSFEQQLWSDSGVNVGKLTVPGLVFFPSPEPLCDGWQKWPWERMHRGSIVTSCQLLFFPPRCFHLKQQSENGQRAVNRKGAVYFNPYRTYSITYECQSLGYLYISRDCLGHCYCFIDKTSGEKAVFRAIRTGSCEPSVMWWPFKLQIFKHGYFPFFFHLRPSVDLRYNFVNLIKPLAMSWNGYPPLAVIALYWTCWVTERSRSKHPYSAAPTECSSPGAHRSARLSNATVTSHDQNQTFFNGEQLGKYLWPKKITNTDRFWPQLRWL